VVDVEPVLEVHPREKQRQKRKGPLIVVREAEQVLKLILSEPERLA